MNRNKVLELAREAELARQIALEVPFVVDRLERFAVLIEREVRGVRGSAEPVAFQFQHEDTGLIDFVDPQQVEWGFQKNNPRWQLIGPVFRHPAPAVDAEPVASVHIKDGCLIGSQRKSGVDIPDGQYALYPIGAYPALAVDAEPVARLRFYKGEVVVTKDYETVERNGEFDVYTHPSPAVVHQLVDALEGMFNIAIDSQGVAGYYLNGEIAEWDDFKEIDKTKAALAAAQEAGL